MPFPQDLAGKFIAYSIHQGFNTLPSGSTRVNHVVSGQTQASTLTVYGELATAGAHRSAPAKGPLIGGQRAVDPQYVASGPAWQFNYLRYVAGDVTVCPVGTGVLTGPMSGCYLFSYTDTTTGNEMVAHVGTAHTLYDDQSVAAKNNWHQYAGLANVTNVKGNSPLDFFDDLADFVEDGNMPQICGLFLPGAAAFALVVVKRKSKVNPSQSMTKIAAVRAMPLMDWSAIRSLRTFRT